MFTGLVEATGRIEAVTRRSGSAVLRISCPFADELSRGDSVAVNGACLTVSGIGRRAFECQAVERTVTLTTLREIRRGTEVNLERALKVGDRIGGHIVTGHVDGVGIVSALSATANGRDVTVDLPEELVRYVATRGSIALDGVSLTVAEREGTRVTVSLIPETLARTVARRYARGTKVNVETDVMAKHQASLRSADGEKREERASITMERLRELGFTE